MPELHATHVRGALRVFDKLLICENCQTPSQRVQAAELERARSERKREEARLRRLRTIRQLSDYADEFG